MSNGSWDWGGGQGEGYPGGGYGYGIVGTGQPDMGGQWYTIDQLLQFAAQGACGFVPEGFWRDLCRSYAGSLGGAVEDPGPAFECPTPTVYDPVTGQCMHPGSPADVTDPGGGIPWVPVKGKYGVAESPMTERQLHRSCRNGMVLGKDDNCYHPQTLHKWERKWPRGPRPLLTGGEMAAIRKASTAVNKIKRTKKRLKRIGTVCNTL